MMGAVTLANRKQGNQGNYKVVEADVTFSGSYATGGDTVAVANLGMVQVHELLIPSHDLKTKKAVGTGSSQVGSSVKLTGTPTAPKLALYTAQNTEAAAASSQVGTTVRVRFLGK